MSTASCSADLFAPAVTQQIATFHLSSFSLSYQMGAGLLRFADRSLSPDYYKRAELSLIHLAIGWGGEVWSYSGTEPTDYWVI